MGIASIIRRAPSAQIRALKLSSWNWEAGPMRSALPQGEKAALMNRQKSSLPLLQTERGKGLPSDFASHCSSRPHNSLHGERAQQRVLWGLETGDLSH